MPLKFRSKPFVNKRNGQVTIVLPKSSMDKECKTFFKRLREKKQSLDWNISWTDTP